MTLQIFEQIHPVPHDRNRFRIVETFNTCDGTRSRLTHKSFATYEEAQAFVNRDLLEDLDKELRENQVDPE